ncbi:fibronectin type III domain-containing protein [Mariniphaga sp.]|uniref:fibronectin type III domain-containing protein n=1 Tax=Mariniphaga sp. TaxID=1954475 RepID=UPI0035630FE0
MKRFQILFFTAFLFLCANLLFAQINAPSPIPDRVVLNLTENPATSVAITWRTDVSVSEGFCELQPAAEGPLKKEDSKTFKAKTTTIKYEYGDEPVIDANQHSFIFTDLIPGKKYIYRVGASDFWSEWFEYQTPSVENDKFSFIYFGDPQNDLKSQWSRVIRSAYRHAPDCGFMLYCGDLINRAGRDVEWHEWFHAGSFIYGMVPQVMTPGNHDYNDLMLDPHWNAQFTQPTNGPKGLEGTCFVIDYKNLRIISIDSAVDSELENENGYPMQAQKVWLDSVLQANTKKWVIVTTHLPFYSPKENRDNKHLRKHFQPILEKYKVDLVLSGHDHSYGRGRVSDNPQAGHKVMYVVSVSGPKMYEAGDKDWMEHSGADKQLYQLISIDGNELSYQSYTASGELFDEFILNK